MTDSPGLWSERADDSGGALGTWLGWGWNEDAAWAACVSGPALGEVMARLAAVPGAFLAAEVDLAALSGDVLFGLEQDERSGVTAAEATSAAAVLDGRLPAASRRGIAVGLWLSASSAVLGGPAWPAGGTQVLMASLALGMRLAPVVEPEQWVRDAERREEAARLFLLWLGLLPAGEDGVTARRLLFSLDSAARSATLAQAQAALDRKQEIVQRLADSRAREAVARYNHD